MRRIRLLPAGRARHWLAALAAAGGLGAGMAAARPSGPPVESLWYLTEDGGGVESFVRNVHRVTIVAPMAYEVDSAGTLRGRVDARVLRAAHAGGVRVMPVVRQPGFSQTQLARLLRDPAARARAAASLAGTCQSRGYWGLQVDFENIRVQDGPLLTDFYRQIAGVLHEAGCRAGIAVVPRVSDLPGESPYQYWMHRRGSARFRSPRRKPLPVLDVRPLARRVRLRSLGRGR
jgi:spore germination protein YaaH